MRLLLALALFFWAAPAFAQESSQESRLQRDLEIESQTLGRVLPYSLYLPASYDDSGLAYPVVYLLHGYGGGQNDWPGGGAIKPTLDRLIAAGEIPPVIVVMPGVGNSWYVDHADGSSEGRMATALIEDLLPAMDADYRTLGAREGRAVAGLSMGGYGALQLTSWQPDLFIAAASLSGAIFPDGEAAQAAGDFQLRLFKAVYGDPYDPAAFDRWNIQPRLPALAAMERPPAFYLTVGDDDYFGLWRGSLSLFRARRDQGLEAELRVTDGGHDWKLWKDEIAGALIFLGGYLQEPQ